MDTNNVVDLLTGDRYSIIDGIFEIELSPMSGVVFK